MEFGELMAAQCAKDKGLKARECWIDKTTANTVKDLCGAVVCACYSSDVSVQWPRLTERKLETRFGRIRSAFGNAQVCCVKEKVSNMFRMCLLFAHNVSE